MLILGNAKWLYSSAQSAVNRVRGPRQGIVLTCFISVPQAYVSIINYIHTCMHYHRRHVRTYRTSNSITISTRNVCKIRTKTDCCSRPHKWYLISALYKAIFETVSEWIKKLRNAFWHRLEPPWTEHFCREKIGTGQPMPRRSWK